MKKFIATVALLTTLAGCSASAAAATHKETVSLRSATPVADKTGLKTFMHTVKVNAQRTLIKNTITKLRSHVGKTWYVFSGETPRGWDCSGLVKWTYGQMGIPLEHRASKQALSGKKVKTPRIGDIVAFYYHGYGSAFHVGVYVGNGKMINAPRPGTVTREESIANGDFKGYEVRYIRINGIL